MGCDLGRTGIAVTSEGDKFSGKEITISYRIVTSAQGKNQIIALEDLTGIRDRTNMQPRSKQERRLTAKLDQTRHKKGRRAKPRNGFYILICGGFENKLL